MFYLLTEHKCLTLLRLTQSRVDQFIKNHCYIMIHVSWCNILVISRYDHKVSWCNRKSTAKILIWYVSSCNISYDITSWAQALWGQLISLEIFQSLNLANAILFHKETKMPEELFKKLKLVTKKISQHSPLKYFKWKDLDHFTARIQRNWRYITSEFALCSDSLKFLRFKILNSKFSRFFFLHFIAFAKSLLFNTNQVVHDVKNCKKYSPHGPMKYFLTAFDNEVFGPVLV